MIGKILGAIFGFGLAGPIGLMLGVCVGHAFDRGLAQQMQFGPDREKAQKIFFTVTFQVMGCLAKADGRVNEREIAQARAFMQTLGLSHDQMLEAMRHFNAGKDPNFNLAGALDTFNESFQGQWPLRQLFVEMMLQAAYADGIIQPQERQLIMDIANELGFSAGRLAEIEKQFQAEQSFGRQQYERQYQYQKRTEPSRLEQAYALLNVSKTASDGMVKKAWRKLMSEHHPDKLASKGLPPDMMRMANEKARAIQEAYTLICESRRKEGL